MRLEHLRLLHFRNYQQVSIPLEHDITVFYGDNAQGKTNLLEGIYMAARGFSFRTRHEEEIPSFGAEEWAAELQYGDRCGSSCLLVKRYKVRGRLKKENLLNGNPVSPREQYGRVNLVLFTPDDLQLVKGDPALRRKFLNMEIAQISPVYYDLLAQYNRVLQQRNRFLKQCRERENLEEAQLSVWDGALARLAGGILDFRLKALAGIRAAAQQVYDGITGTQGALTLSYIQKQGSGEAVLEENPGPAAWEIFYREQLSQRHQLDYLRGYTSLGPHRDDLEIFHAGRPLRIYGSQGQQRTAALALKLSELEFIRSVREEYPVLLLDDVLSELDEHRREKLLGFINGTVQTFLTVNDRSLAPVKGDAAAYRVREGRMEAEG
ncbi:DNA replication/repair protein RecF [uncultured Acidaminococcus sp.]|uniref:DNA replication/repair protein RecF n=1 Tax=uncultured Acidaminococcus sp. TaxID=352152 RepID=UPI00260B267E|nr:DNA replication/repair protein RecF [uncultured Acidaminococcus sp.]